MLVFVECSYAAVYNISSIQAMTGKKWVVLAFDYLGFLNLPSPW